MQKTGKVLLFFIVFSILFGCQNSKEDTKSKLPDNFQISGQILGAANQSIYLEVVNSKGRVKLAETTTEVDGSFSLKGNVKEERNNEENMKERNNYMRIHLLKAWNEKLARWAPRGRVDLQHV